MKTRILFVLLLLLAAGSGPDTASAADAARPGRPNIVYILADDLGYGDVRANNPHSRIPTPHLDALAAQGMRFTDAHSPSSVCTPTRYGVLTGRYCWRSPVTRGVTWAYGRTFLEEGRETVATLLRRHGYSTGVVGKWHLGLDWALRPGSESQLETAAARGEPVMEMSSQHIDFSRPVTRGPREFGFDYSFILPGSLDIPPYCYLENHQLLAAPTAQTTGNTLHRSDTTTWRAGDMSPGFDFHDATPAITRKSIEFMTARARDSRPFFLYVPLTGPHKPWVPADEFTGVSQAGLYGDFVCMMDAHVGRVLGALRELGLEDNTLVIFTSDNGPFWRPELIERYGHRAAGPFRGMKGDVWEGGHRVPYLARWPGRIAAGSVSPALTSLTHLLATVADLLGLPEPNRLAEDSYSILPVLLGQAERVIGQPGIMMHSSQAHFAWREGDWKYIEKRGSGGFTSPVTFATAPGEAPAQLYNLAEDPGETDNVYFRYPQKVEALRRNLELSRGTRE